MTGLPFRINYFRGRRTIVFDDWIDNKKNGNSCQLIILIKGSGIRRCVSPIAIYIGGKMRKNLLLSLLLICTLHAFADINNGNVTVTLTGLKTNKGNIVLALVNSKESFDSEDIKPFMGAVVQIKDGSAAYTFKNVPYGEYAIKFFHDENGSGKLEYGLFGIPREQYGFSNNVRSKNYTKAQFEFNQPELTLTINAR